ncbi:hypothetical protein L3X38_036373 [Prunus dulcis]|uniref:Uncharacterized protein n=1 Tax=Prunus dulcis TaxID=3755 RepID=A0AAD4V379_PRUDU|nr:hypothetical protein L3X38_036373 [Prunus dulcis]
MLNHIRKYCKYYPTNVDKNQKMISGDKSQGKKLVAKGFVQTDVLEACAEIIIIDELPFSFVEKKGFRKFCSVACPLFNIPSRRTIAFVRMREDEDNPFLAYFKEPEHEVDKGGVVLSSTKYIRVGPPSEDDWENATVFVKFLRVLL